MSATPLKLATSARAVAFKGDDLMELAKARAVDPTVFDDRDGFFWRAEISNSNLDFYYTRMAEQTLRNFADDSTAGVAFQDSHDYRKLGFGRSLRGEFIAGTDTDEEGIVLNKAETDFYTLRGLNLNGVNTNDFIDGVRAGILSDVSVGFFATEIRCSICGGEMFQGWFGIHGVDCDHVPGLTYAVTNEDGQPKIDGNGREVKRTAFAWIMDGRLSEVSIVYDGATPNAAVLKSELMAAEGRLTDHERSTLERRYRTRLPVPDRTYAVIQGRNPDMTVQNKDKPTPRDTSDGATAEETVVAATESTDAVTDETTVADLEARLLDAATETEDDAPADEDAELAEIRATFAAEGITIGNDRNKAIRVLAETVVKYRALAAVGKRYRDDLEKQAEQELVRARGEKANLDMYRGIFGRATIDELSTLIADFRSEGEARFPGERVTVDTDEHATNILELPKNTDARAFRA